MQNYRIKKQVPWQDVLHVLRWHLKMRVRDYKRYCQFLQGELPDKNIAEAAQNAVMDSYRSYSALRSFLGYHVKTKLEREALEVMRNIP